MDRQREGYYTYPMDESQENGTISQDDFDAEQNLVGLFSVLFEIDLEQNPELYRHPENVTYLDKPYESDNTGESIG